MTGLHAPTDPAAFVPDRFAGQVMPVAGAAVVLADIDAGGAEAPAADIVGAGGRAVGIGADVTSRGDRTRTVAAAPSSTRAPAPA